MTFPQPVKILLKRGEDPKYVVMDDESIERMKMSRVYSQVNNGYLSDSIEYETIIAFSLTHGSYVLGYRHSTSANSDLILFGKYTIYDETGYYAIDLLPTHQVTKWEIIEDDGRAYYRR